MNNTNTRVLHEVNSFVYHEEMPRNSSTNMYGERDFEYIIWYGDRVTGWTPRLPAGETLFCVLQRVRMVCGPIQPSMKWVLGRELRWGGVGSVFLGIKRSGHEALQAPLLSTEV